MKSNNTDAFKMHHNMMQISGVWPEIDPGISYRIRCILSWMLGLGLSVTMAMEVYQDLTDFAKLSEILYIMVSETVYVIKLSSFTYHRKTFLDTVRSLGDPVFVSYPLELDHYMVTTIKVSTLIANSYRYLCLCCMIMFAAYPVFDSKPLPFPFPYDFGRYRYFMYVFQVASISSSAWNNSCLDTLTTSLMGIAAAQLDILAEKISRIRGVIDERRLAGDLLDGRVLGELRQCVDHHLAIIRFVESIEKIFTVGLLAQFLASIIVICNTLFHFVLVSATSSQFFMLANYFAIMVSQLCMYCWYGNEIMWKSIRVGEACYSFEWYKYGNEVRKYSFIIMERSKRPLAVTALKFSKLSLRALTSILQWSYSYLALLMKMYNKSAS